VPDLAFFSVVVPTRGRRAQLASCLASLERLEYPKHRFEVIVVDDGGHDPAHQVVDQFRERLPVTGLRQNHCGPASARNAGAAGARGALLAFTDDDCAPAPTWLLRLGDCFASPETAAVGGRTRNVLHHNKYSTASQLLVDYLYEYFNDGRTTFLTSNNLAVRADVFESVGGFDGTFPLPAGEDREFVARLNDRGYKVAYAPQALVDHAHDLGPRSFIRQHFTYGRGAFHFHRLRARRGVPQLEGPKFYLDLLRWPLGPARCETPFAIAAMLGISQGANAAGYFWEKASTKAGRRSAPKQTPDARDAGELGKGLPDSQGVAIDRDDS
jgi:cellulose synthase/poly-beta-1,6-N-acetylglucosamine synthase-like glycosyltransferase